MTVASAVAVALLAAALLAAAARAGAPAVTTAAGGEVTIYESPAEPVPANRIDELVFARWRELGLTPARPCSDAVFVRRVFLDVTGTLPTAEEARSFVADPAPDKRVRLIERLLAREEFNDYWAMKWADWLRVKAEFPIRLWPKAAEAYYRWIRQAIAENRPYDRVARELLLATGSNFYAPESNFYRAMPARQPEDIARAVALTFLGVRLEQWPEARRAEMAAFFARVRYKGTSEWKEEIVYLDPSAAPAATLTLPDGRRVKLHAGADARAAFADWLITAENPWFARAAVNRIWFWLLGRGVVHEPDDFRADNPPAVPGLLDYLASELADSGWNLRHIYRLILNSQTYQLSAIPRSEDARAEAYFARYPLRRLEAEVLLDAVNRITGATDRYTSAVPEPFTYLPEEMRAIEIPDGNTTSAVLELFGRPARDTGRLTERNNADSPGQRLHLLNSRHIHGKISQSRSLSELSGRLGARPEELVEELYWRALSRAPTPGERRAAVAYREASRARGREFVTDVVWALINSDEFLYRH